ncbi:hypothetical protein [Curtobacterium sp. Leaf261]|nr:hypothetical protein [Curtobacterium sp. Leaf261]
MSFREVNAEPVIRSEHALISGVKSMKKLKASSVWLPAIAPTRAPVAGGD